MSADAELSRRSRGARADPADVLGWRRWFRERARAIGEAAWLERLDSLSAWDETPDEVQDEAVARVLARLSGFALIETRRYVSGPATHRIATLRHEPSGIAFQLLPAGPFAFGRDDGFDNEQPRLTATIPAPFLLARFPLTQDEWLSVPDTPAIRASDPRAPLVRVSWNEAMDWCARAELRLPTEREWEFACRAGTTTRFDFGEAFERERVWCWATALQRPRPPLASHANSLGLIDMIGNVWEWCSDPWTSRHDAKPLAAEAWRVHRGGSWRTGETVLSASLRGWHRPEWRGFDLGIRAARSLPECKAEPQRPSSPSRE